jgi:hypothetical protein
VRILLAALGVAVLGACVGDPVVTVTVRNDCATPVFVRVAGTVRQLERDDSTSLAPGDEVQEQSVGNAATVGWSATAYGEFKTTEIRGRTASVVVSGHDCP